jgi:hypothetical protein
LIRRSRFGIGAGITMALLVGVLAGCKPSPEPATRTEPAASKNLTFEKILADNKAAIASGEAMVKGPIDSTAVPLELVRLYGERARLTGNYDDYARAEELLARLPANFDDLDALCMARARLHYTLHRLARAKAQLDRCPRLAGTAEDALLRANIAFHTGRYKDAGTIYRALVNQIGTPQTYIQLALYYHKTGSPGEAAALMEAAEKRYHGRSAIMQSWLALQRGLIALDRGRYDEARALFTLADHRMPGYWLTDEHLAEIAQLKGDITGAKRIYADVVRRTGAPEYLDALASIEAEAGNAAAARALLDRAEAIYTARAKRFPEAIAGHALEHYLSADPQPAKALAFAEANFSNRPYGDAAIALARAYLLNSRPRDALRMLEQQLEKGWDTAETHWIVSVAAKAAGDAGRSKSAAIEALRRNPYSATQYAL